MNIRISKVDFLQEPSVVTQIIKVHQLSFPEIWAVRYLCPVCKLTLAQISADSLCPDCRLSDALQVPLVEYLPGSYIVSNLYAEMQKPGSVCIVAKNRQDEVVGFVRGYEVEVKLILRETYEAPMFCFKSYCFLEELAVVPSERGKGIGGQLIEDFPPPHWEGYILIRTSDNRVKNIFKNIGAESMISEAGSPNVEFMAYFRKDPYLSKVPTYRYDSCLW